MGQPFEGLQITGYDNIEKAYKTFRPEPENSAGVSAALTGKICLITGASLGIGKSALWR